MSQPIAVSPLDRLMVAIRAIIRAEFPTFSYLGVFEYAIQAATATTVDATPTDSTLPLPSLSGLPMRSGILGETATLTVGNRCLVAFVNGDPSRPVVLGADPIPVTSTVDAKTTISIGPSASVVLAGGSMTLAAGPSYVAALNALDAFAVTINAGIGTLSPSTPLTANMMQAAFTTLAGALNGLIAVGLNQTTRTKAT